MNNVWRKLINLLLVLILSVGSITAISGCEREKDVGDQLDEAADEAGDAIEEAGDEIDDAL